MYSSPRAHRSEAQPATHTTVQRQTRAARAHRGCGSTRCGPRLAVEVVVVVGRRRRGEGRAARRRGAAQGRAAAADAALGELEGGAEAARLLQRLREHLVLADVVVAHRAARELHRLLEVGLGDLGHEVGHLVRLHGVGVGLGVGRALLLLLDLLLDRLANGELGGALADLGQVGAAEAVHRARHELEVDVGRDGRLAQHRLEDVQARALVGQRDVDELVEAAGAHDGRVEDVGPVGGADDEDGLLGADAVDLGEDLVDDAVARLATAAARATLLGDRVDLVEEQDARRRAARLVKKLAHVLLALAKPHGEELGALDRDEVGLDLVGDGLRHEGLAAARRSVEQHPLGGRHTIPLVLCGELERVLQRLDHLTLDVEQAAHIRPAHIGDLDGLVAQRRRRALLHRRPEVFVGHDHSLEQLGGHVVGVHVDLACALAHRLHGGLRNELPQVGARVAVRVGGHLLEVDLSGEAHGLGLDLQDGQAAVVVRDAEVHLAVEAAEAAERGVDNGRPVGRRHHHDARLRAEAVHEREQLRDDAALDLALRLLALGRDRVDLVDEDDGGRVLLGLLEGLAQVRLRLAGELGHDLRPVDQEEEGARLVGHGARDERLARAGRAEEQDAARRLDADRLEQLRVTQG
mmetsp:Transcript_22949/g.54586  ORF Transcript_22949/g.54586 Transcript_22949/m.54586 type:complete len:636 (-) Transcript_22949:718-2625(-)